MRFSYYQCVARRVVEEVTGLGLRNLCNVVEPVDVRVRSVREHLGEDAVQVKRVSGGCAVENALKTIIESGVTESCYMFLSLHPVLNCK
jgi:hypothetical protein